MRKLVPVLVLLAFSVACSVQNSSLQERWPGSDGAPHNVHAITTNITPSTPAAESLTRPIREVEPRPEPARPPGVGQGNNYDPRTHGTTSGEL